MGEDERLAPRAIRGSVFPHAAPAVRPRSRMNDHHTTAPAGAATMRANAPAGRHAANNRNAVSRGGDEDGLDARHTRRYMTDVLTHTAIPARAGDQAPSRRQSQPRSAPSTSPASGANGTPVVTLTTMPIAKPSTAPTPMAAPTPTSASLGSRHHHCGTVRTPAPTRRVHRPGWRRSNGSSHRIEARSTTG
jgi:hypothetical protein